MRYAQFYGNIVEYRHKFIQSLRCEGWRHIMENREAILFSDSYSINLLTLRKAILAFDKIRIIDLHKHGNLIPFGAIEEKFTLPDGKICTVGYADHGTLIVRKGETSAFDIFLEDIKNAINNNFIIVQDPTPALRKKAPLVKLSYGVDLSDTEIMGIASKGINEKVLTGNSFDVDRVSLLENLLIVPSGCKSVWTQIKAPTNVPFENIIDDDLRESIRHLSRNRLTKIYTALALADEYSAFPLTDNSALNEVIICKYKLLSSLNDGAVKDVFALHKGSEAFKYNLMCHALIEDIIPDEELINISIKKLIAYKRASSEALGKFHGKLKRIISLIESEPWDGKIENEIRKIINKDIRPEIDAVFEAKVLLKDKILGSFVKCVPDSLYNTLKYMVPYHGITSILKSTSFIMPAFSIAEILLFSGLFGAHILSKSIPELYDKYIENKTIKRNSFTYLINLKKVE
jgi:hypothetical protein